MPASSNEIVVYGIRQDTIFPDQAISWLSADEIQRAASFVHDTHRSAWIHWRAALRSVLASHLGLHPGEIHFESAEHGKPQLASSHRSDLQFNLSHCEDFALIAVHETHPVGIDLEPLHRASSLMECASGFCHFSEISRLPDTPTAQGQSLLEIWTAKEAVLKALGCGLLFPPTDVRVDLEDHPRTVQLPEGRSYQAIRLEDPILTDYSAHLCALKPDPIVTMIDYSSAFHVPAL